MAENGDQHAEQIEELERELQDKSLLLANLEVMIEDYRREKSRLLGEIMALKEKLWDLTGRGRDADEASETSGE